MNSERNKTTETRPKKLTGQKVGKEMIMEYITLNNGVKCPAAGIGTFMLSPAEAENSVREALKMGYRLVDTANAYVSQ